MKAPMEQQVCVDAQAELQANPGWLRELRDPILNGAEEIRQRVDRYSVLFRCLSTGGIAITGEMVEVDRLLNLFMLFAAGSLFPEAQPGASNYTLTFADIQDPAVRALRDELGIPAPPGYVYIWLYRSRGDLPESLQEYVLNDSIRGLTFQTRYIVVFDEVRPGTPLEEYERSKRSAVLSHEFVHAYIKSYLGPERGFSLPTWYDEGLAIYFSGSSDPSSTSYFDENGRQVTWSIPPKNYARYRDDFLYLEQSLGREKLLALIRRSILENNPDILLSEAGIAGEEELFKIAEEARVRRGLTRLAFFAGIPAALGLLIAAFALIRRAAERRRLERLFDDPSLSPPPATMAVTSHARAQPVDRVSGLVQQLQAREETLSDRSGEGRYFAALSLARLDDPRVAEALLGALTDECALVRAGAARGLGEWAERMARSARLTGDTRARVISGLFPLLERDPANEARWAAAEAVYKVGGASGLRPVQAAVRRWSSEDPGSAALHQAWFVRWAGDTGQPGLLVDAYRWCGPDARRAIIEHLRSLPASERERLLVSMRQSSDQQVRELAQSII